MADLHTLKAILFDTGGVLYHRPRQDEHLKAFLKTHGLTLRHRAVLQKALRAARFDAQTGRITIDMFYDALLRVNGLTDERLFPEGRDAIYQDAVDIELFPGVPDVLEHLHTQGILLGTVSDTAHAASEKIAWLAARGVSPGLWGTFVVSYDARTTKTRPEIFLRALAELEVRPEAAGFVGHATDELNTAKETGLTTIAFLPDDYAVETDHTVGSFYDLPDLLAGTL